jgi:alpha-ketoglutarate-dependent taurine dioxygenase
MTTNLDVGTIDVIRCSSLDNFQKQLNSIYERIEKNGFVILQGWDTSDETFKEIAQFFGYLQNHPNADDSGLVKVKPERSKKTTDTYERFPGKSTGEILLHTDGSYLDGFDVVNGKVVRINPPTLVILQCIRALEREGTYFLVDTQEILQLLWVEAPEHAKVVTQPRTVSYCAGQDFSTYSPLFEKLPSSRWQVRFRSDLMYIEPWAYNSVKHVVQNYLFNPKFRKLHYLSEGQILIMDNYRVLHGRGEIISENFEQSQLLNQTWIWDASTDYVLPFVDAPPDPNAFKAFEKYRPLNTDVANKAIRPLQTGIKIQTK